MKKIARKTKKKKTKKKVLHEWGWSRQSIIDTLVSESDGDLSRDITLISEVKTAIDQHPVQNMRFIFGSDESGESGDRLVKVVMRNGRKLTCVYVFREVSDDNFEDYEETRADNLARDLRNDVVDLIFRSIGHWSPSDGNAIYWARAEPFMSITPLDLMLSRSKNPVPKDKNKEVQLTRKFSKILKNMTGKKEIKCQI